MQPFYPPKCCDVRLGCALCATHSKLRGFSRLRENEALLVTHGAKAFSDQNLGLPFKLHAVIGNPTRSLS